MANTWRERFGNMLIRSAQPQHDPSAALDIPHRSAVNNTVSVADAFGLSAVYRAISIHAIAAKQLSFDAYRGGVELTLDQTPAWLRRPDIESTRSAFIESTIVSLACAGNAYWKITRNDRGVQNLDVLNPLDVLVEAGPSGKAARFKYQGKEYRPDEIQHLKLLRVPGSVTGLGPIQAAQRELRGAIDVRDYASNWFTGSGAPAAGYLQTDQALSPDVASRLRDDWQRATANREGSPVLGQGAKYVPLFISPEDAQWITAQRFNVTATARLFGVPSSLMLAAIDGVSDSYQNVSQDWLGYVRFSLQNYLTEIEDAFSALLPRGMDAKFNIEALLRSDTQTRYTTHNLAILGGWMLRSEARAIEGLPPIAGIDDAPKPEVTV